MDLKEFSEKVELTRASLESRGIDNIHMLFGMVTEVGELVDVFKKKIAYGKIIDWINVKEEVGDLLWYVIGFCNINGWDLEEILDTTAKKLESRYKGKFSQEKAKNRNLQEERSVLEENFKGR